jgi:Ca2+-binding RTX toxin-like protein
MVFYSDSSVGVSVNLATGRGLGGTAEGDTYVSIEAVWGSSFNDTITGDGSANDLYGNDGNDVLKGGGGADGLDGGSGNDILKGGGGADLLIGGAGTDTADYSQGFGATVDLALGQGFGGDAEGDTLISIENVTGSTFDDVIRGNDSANGLRGGDGVDRLQGGGGSDTLDGGAGADELDGGTGADTMIGGAGDDVYRVDSAGDVVLEDAGQGAFDQVAASVSYALSAAAEVERMFTTNVAATVALDLSGNDFAQQITGNNGSNVLQGFGGNDVLDGAGGFDRLFGGTGQDTLWGGGGPDDLFGGAGADFFLFTVMAESGIVAGTFDVIHDFNPAEGDKIDVRLMDSDPAVSDTQGWTFIGATTTFTAPGQIGFSSDGVDTFILFNNDTDAIHEATIRVLGVQTVDAGWFNF